MSQTYPAALPSTLKVQDGTALYNPTPTNATVGTSSGDVWHPNVWSEKIKAHPGGPVGWTNMPATPADADFVQCTLMPRACNMPYQ